MTPDIGDRGAARRPTRADSEMAMLVLRLWLDPGRAEVHGRVLSPELPNPTAAGKQDLMATLELALDQIASTLRRSRDGTATQD